MFTSHQGHVYYFVKICVVWPMKFDVEVDVVVYVDVVVTVAVTTLYTACVTSAMIASNISTYLPPCSNTGLISVNKVSSVLAHERLLIPVSFHLLAG